MRTYRVVWRAVCGAFVASGVVIGVVVLPVTVWVAVSLLAVVLALTLAVGGEGDETGPKLRPWRAVLIAAAACAALVATVAVGVFLGVGVLAPLLILGAGAPPAVNWYARMLKTTGSRGDPVGAASTTELCSRWLESYDTLKQAGSCEARLRVVIARQRCLDELERRDPDGFQAWLASAAGAATDPRRFFTDHGT